MLDEREGAVSPEDLQRAFTRKPPWQRILVLLAGPALNILFAIFVFWAMFWVNGVDGRARGGGQGHAGFAGGGVPACAPATKSSSIDGTRIARPG